HTQDKTRQDETRWKPAEISKERSRPSIPSGLSVRYRETSLPLPPSNRGNTKEKLRSSGEERRAHNPEVTRSKRVAANLECYIFVLFFYLVAHTSSPSRTIQQAVLL